MARRMEEQKHRAFRSAPRRPRPRARVPRSADKRSTEQDRVRTWTCITNSHGSSEQQHQRSPREGAQGTGTASRVPATHVGAAITDAAVSSTTGVCSDGSHSTARGNTTSSNGVDIRGDAAKDVARVVRDGSTPQGQCLREQLWVWLHLQDEEATEPVPKQLQSWLTGQKTQQRKEFKRNRRHHSSQTDLIETTYHSSRCQTRISHDDPDQPRLDGELGRDHGDRTRQIEGHLKATKTLDDNSQTPVRDLLEYVWAQ